MTINDKADKVIENVFGLMDVKMIWKHQWEVVILSLCSCSLIILQMSWNKSI